MKFSLNTTITLLLALPLAMAAAPAAAGPTSLAKVPLMSLADSGSVKPNLMLLYDDSGSMAFSHTPDYVARNTSCRAVATLAGGLRECEVGDVPYNSPQFNRQYYNPKLRYLPPQAADGSSYPIQTASVTSNWTKVTTDGFGIEWRDLLPDPERGTRPTVKNTNLVTGFPDIEWCNRSDVNHKDAVCQRNVVGYSYPDNTYRYPRRFTTNAYYYTLNVNEYCTKDDLKTCKTTGINAPAPDATYTKPALVRWCTDANLGTCQAKYTGTNVYPRFGDPSRARTTYSTITINDSGSDATVMIDQVYSVGNGTTQEITGGALTFSGGTNSATERAAAAAALALSIIDKTGLSRPFTACVRQTTGRVPSCAAYGITLVSDDVVAVLPIACSNTKNKTGCSIVNSGDRITDQVVVESPQTVTGLMTFTGRSATNKEGTTRLIGLRFGGQAFFTGGLNLNKNLNSEAVVKAIVASVGERGAVKAYIGGNDVTPQCKASNSTSTLCLVGPLTAVGSTPSIDSISGNYGNLKYTVTSGASSFLSTSVAGFDMAVFSRTDIVSTRNSYPKDAARTDCAGTTCTFIEEITNFANWYAYYKTRNQMMKTSVGRAFQPLDDDFKVGLVSLQLAAGQTAYTSDDDKIQFPKPFTAEARTAWYDGLYKMKSSGGTPVRQALHEMGNMFANKGRFPQAKGSEVVEFACQQNFTFITTDGYWNGPTAPGVLNNDNKEDTDRFCTVKSGCVDTRVADDPEKDLPSLADVALYWYNGGNNTLPKDGVASLRPDLEGDEGAVRGTGNKRLHMRTYGLGLGVDGIMTYEPNYDKGAKAEGDLWSIMNSVKTGCPWNNNGAYVWPDPKTNDVLLSDTIQARVDDLWHAAINGRGKYFSASDPQQVVDGLNEALSNITETIGAASSAATSTPNLTQEDRDIFASTFTTGRWTGNLTKREINLVSGEVDPSIKWSSSWTVGKKVQAAADTRSIWYRDPASGGRVEFLASNLGATETAWFADKCAALSQCKDLLPAQKTIVNQPATIVNWLRGQHQYADGVVLRAYNMDLKEDADPKGSPQMVVLGDIASSKPAYLRGARKSYTSDDYAKFKTDQAERSPTVFVAANDGMVHAFDASGGEELWGYMPRLTMKKLHLQASLSYATDHHFTVDGSPELADVQIGGKWRTILVGGFNGGGRGFYALDVTDPAQPAPLWEICADSSVCSGTSLQPELGLSFGNPQFGTIRDGKNPDGSDKHRWVVFLTSGYNNTPGSDGIDAGSGKGFLFVVDVATGAQVLNLGSADIMAGGILTTGSGGTGATGASDPSGLAKITAITANPNTDPLITYVYGGDNLGQMWRWDFTGTTVKRILMGNAGADQPITTRPEVTMCAVDSSGNGTNASGTERVVVFGTGRMLDYVDIAGTKTQSVYVLKDSGAPVSASNWRNGSSFAERTLQETRPPVKDKPSLGRSNEFTMDGDEVDLSDQEGWFFDLNQHTGERVNLDPKVVSGTLSVVSNVPQSSTACNVGGVSFSYHLNVCTGEQLGDLAGSVLSDKAAVVGFIIVRLPSGELKLIGKGADGEDIEKEVTSANSKDARRTGWRRVRD